jgi:aquaporin Z
MNIRALVAEAIGTFILITFGSLGVATVLVLTDGQGNGTIASIIVPFSFGLGLLAAIGIGGHVSGGHFNPAVTLAAVLDGRLGWRDGIGYGVAQVLGGVAASLGLLLVTSTPFVTATVNAPGPIANDQLGAELHAFSVEAILTAVFVAVILTVTVKGPRQAILVIPLTLAGIHFAAMHISGASVNPVRSLAPAVVSGTYTSLWVYLTGPFVGSILGWAAYRFLTPPEETGDDEGEDDGDEEDLDDDMGDDDDLEDDDRA